jgi:hypothetical protein
MANEVYANNMELSCKAGSGKSICAFPDVCFTPPTTPATPPGVPIPYPNTGMTSDCTDGSSSVKVSNQEVMLKNKSYFKRSMGDEAGCAPKKGVVTSKNMGKVYFNMWSMDVKIEGENVVRHFDLTTHNHASVPGNSPTWPFLSKLSASAAQKACGKEMQAVKTNCPNCDTMGKTHDDCPDIGNSKTKNAGVRNDPCVKAKRCMLVPYDRSKSQGGCCEGQTPHHIVPKHHFEGVSGYDEGDAPCVCVEGHSWHREDKSPFNKRDKTHPDMHDLQDSRERAAIDVVETLEANGDDTKGRTPDHAMKYGEARDGGVAAHQEVFPDCKPPCSKECLDAQIDAYHRQKKVGMRDGTAVRTKRVGSDLDNPEATQEFMDMLT